MASNTHRPKDTRPSKTAIIGFRWFALACALICPGATWADGVATNLPSDTPKTFYPRTNSFDYVTREEMIAMRDGVKLKTFIVVPKGATNGPMLLTRTPY